VNPEEQKRSPPPKRIRYLLIFTLRTHYELQINWTSEFLFDGRRPFSSSAPSSEAAIDASSLYKYLVQKCIVDCRIWFYDCLMERLLPGSSSLLNELAGASTGGGKTFHEALVESTIHVSVPTGTDTKTKPRSSLRFAFVPFNWFAIRTVLISNERSLRLLVPVRTCTRTSRTPP
jgi:hypothetical protein